MRHLSICGVYIPSIFRALQPAQYLSKFLVRWCKDLCIIKSVCLYFNMQEHGIRPDGRQSSDPRPVTINIGGINSTMSCIFRCSAGVVLLGSVSTADGSSLVRVGDTLVTCGVKAVSLQAQDRHHSLSLSLSLSLPPAIQELCNPPVENGNCGYLVCNVNLPPLCSPLISPGPPSTHSQALSQSLQDTLIRCVL